MQTALPRSLSVTDGIALVVGSILGSGIFASPGLVFRATKSGGLALVVWAFGGLVAISGALCYVELGTALPSAGGEVTYLRRAFGELAAFLFMWTNVFVGRPAAFAITCIVAGENACRFVTGWRGDECHGSDTAASLSMACLVLTAALNALSTKASTKVLSLTLSSSVVAMAVISMGGVNFAWNQKASADRARLDFDGAQDSWVKLGPAFMSAMWAFDGWNTLNYSTEEMVDANAMRKIIWISLPLITVLYLAVNAA